MSVQLTMADEKTYRQAIDRVFQGGPPVAYGLDVAGFRPEIPVTEPDAALVVLTSGSIESPKAVVLSRQALAHSVAATHDRLGGAGDWVCALPLQYVAGTMTVVRAVLGAGQLYLAEPKLSNLPKPNRRTYISLVPTQLSRALADPKIARRLASYSAVLIGGARLANPLREAADIAGLNLVTTYGMAETCGGCVYDSVPLAGVKVNCDTSQRVWINTPTAFSGYRLRPDLTSETLVSGSIRTKDRGRCFDGRLEILGRLDETAIVGGVNVDVAQLRELVFDIFGDPLTGGVAVVAIDDPYWGEVVIGLTDGSFTLAEVCGQLAIVDNAKPKALFRLDRLPETETGKIDYPTLRDIAREEWYRGHS